MLGSTRIFVINCWHIERTDPSINWSRSGTLTPTGGEQRAVEFKMTTMDSHVYEAFWTLSLPGLMFYACLARERGSLCVTVKLPVNYQLQ
jgi:hypothetical protein